jgi:ABC-type oligopeptide transport system ATPase subunit
VTENEVHLMIKANDYISRLKLIPGRAATGQLLTQNQRDQMMRTMAHMNNMAASAANDTLLQARDRMIESGQKNEIHLPHPYVNNLILKKDAVDQIKKLGSEIKALELRRVAAMKANDSNKANLISEKMKEMLHEQESFSSRLENEEFTSSPLLGGVDFEKKRQGYVGGTGGYLFNMPSASENQVDIREPSE